MSRSNFRRRRLTYAKRGSRRGSISPPPKTVFSAGEIGEEPTLKPPFPSNLVGSYSCHGIEPAYDEVDGSDVIVAKINQDRGCMAYPYGRDAKQVRGAISLTRLMNLLASFGAVLLRRRFFSCTRAHHKKRNL